MSSPRLPSPRWLSLLLAVALLSLTSGVARAANPPAPAPGYTPPFITETDQPGPWLDCMWASLSMLLEKWSQGQLPVERHALRAASGDREGGSSMADVARGARSLGIELRYSPEGGDPLTWEDLLDRLAHGGGALLAGNYAQLPAHYTRWNRSFAAKPLPSHAVYVERYEPKTGRLWLMDPLGRGDYNGEWISAAALQSYAFIAPGGLLYAAATPAPPDASVSGYHFGDPTFAPPLLAGSSETFSLPITEPGPWPLPAMSLRLEWTQLASYPPAPLASPPSLRLPAVSGDANLSAPFISQAQSGADLPKAGKELVASSTVALTRGATPVLATATSKAPPSEGLGGEVNTPAMPGHYALSLQLLADGRPVAPPSSQTLDIFGPLGASYLFGPLGRLSAGQPFLLQLAVTNAGGLSWAPPPRWSGTGPAQLELYWDGDRETILTRVALDLLPGVSAPLTLTLSAPSPGIHLLHADVISPDGQSLAALGVPDGKLALVVGYARAEENPLGLPR